MKYKHAPHHAVQIERASTKFFVPIKDGRMASPIQNVLGSIAAQWLLCAVMIHRACLISRFRMPKRMSSGSIAWPEPERHTNAAVYYSAINSLTSPRKVKFPSLSA